VTTIQAWQHIYSNVEKEQSPQGRGGFQTLFYSPGLTDAEIEEMEGRLLYFASQVEPVKRLFFSTSSGKGVVAQIVFLPRPDQYGRGGRYFAHALAFDPQTLPKFKADPFRVFRQFTFIETVEEALAQGDFQTGQIPPVLLALPHSLAGEIEAAKSWSTPALNQLTLLALRAQQQAQARQAITVTGPPAKIERALEAAFLAVPVSMRPHCSFDTYFYRCNLVATYFWAIGLPEPPVSIKFVQIDAQSRSVQGQAPSQPQTSYERWALGMLEANKLSEIVARREYAFAVGGWLDDQPYNLERLNQASSEIITGVMKASPEAVQEAVRRGVRSKLPAALVDRAAGEIYQHESKLALYKQLRQGFALPHLVEALYNSYAAQSFKAPARPEVSALESLLEQVSHPMLRLFVAHWKSSRKELPQALKWAEKEDYRQFVQLALKLELVEPFALLIPGRGNDFLDLYLNTQVDNVAELAEALVEAEAFACLPRLKSHIPTVGRKGLTKLSRLIEGRAEQIPQSFQQAVNEAIKTLPPETGLKGMLKSMWRKLPGG